MPSIKDIAKVTAVAKVAYNKVYALLEDDAKISDTRQTFQCLPDLLRTRCRAGEQHP